ncbi:MAG: hypothetical protein H7258_14895 [Ferruginibacter sp.]|nr:hypothetical protein [Ferruginibacter sp.]
MKRLIPFILALAVLSSCGSSKNYLERSDADKALQDAVKKLNKNNSDENASQALPVLYRAITENHLAKIKSFETSEELNRWDKIINEYEYLQNAYEAIVNSSASFKLVDPKSYSTALLETKQAAAEAYYVYANSFYDQPGRENAKKAYTNFKKSERYIPGYKDAKLNMDRAYEQGIVNVVINPVEDNSFFFNSGWGNSGYNYSNEYFQQTLVRELGNNSNRYPARFYTDWQARRDNIKPDWVIDLRLANMNIPYPLTNSYSRNVNAQIQTGTDTSGKAIYNTVYATLNVTRMSFTARADMEVNIKDIATGKNVSYRSFRDDYRWEQEKGSYTGDSRALSNRDWQLINNSSYYAPRKEDVLNELYRKIYPQVKNNISYAVDW